jgi:hypothetical protein
MFLELLNDFRVRLAIVSTRIDGSVCWNLAISFSQNTRTPAMKRDVCKVASVTVNRLGL